MRAALFLAALVTISPALAHAQWELEESHTTASLRGITNVGGGVAWASGTDGTVLRTEDGGYLWQGCATPPGAEHLDFRGIQAFDENTAIVMSSGPGDLSRLYKTTDGCLHWKLLFTNPDKDGFWDALQLNTRESDGILLGDPVKGKFSVWRTNDRGASWQRDNSPSLTAMAAEGAFAASNSSLIVDNHLRVRFGTGGAKQAHVFRDQVAEGGFQATAVPLAAGSPSAGVFSIAFRTFLANGTIGAARFVAVGGDYSKSDQRIGTGALSVDDGYSWQPAQTPPHGYRSSVAYDPATKTWITVGPNGSDYSTDDGRNWHPLGPTPQDQPGSDRDWNALSLPFVVGPHGRIGKVRTDALPAPKPTAAK